MASQYRPSGATVFYPEPQVAAQMLQAATVFTRINVRATSETVMEALNRSPHLQNTFLLGHLNNILVFDADQEEHTTHVKAVLQMLTDEKLKADIKLCAFTKPSWVEAGFRIEVIQTIPDTAFMILLSEHLQVDE